MSCQSKRETKHLTMKNLIFLFALSLPLMVLAQHPIHGEQLSVEQRATLQAKKMQLALELSDNQTNQLIAIFKNNPRPEPPKKKENLSSEDRYEMHLKRLDHRIAVQKEVNAVLNEEQKSTWKKMQHSKKSQMAHRERHPKQNHPSRKRKN